MVSVKFDRIYYMNVDIYDNSIVVDCLDLLSNSNYTGDLKLLITNRLSC